MRNCLKTIRIDVELPFDRLRANVLATVPSVASVLVKVPFVLSLSKRLFGIVSKSLTDYEMASRRSPRSAPTGAHKRRPNEWLSGTDSGRCGAYQGIPMFFENFLSRIRQNSLRTLTGLPVRSDSQHARPVATTRAPSLAPTHGLVPFWTQSAMWRIMTTISP